MDPPLKEYHPDKYSQTIVIFCKRSSFVNLSKPNCEAKQEGPPPTCQQKVKHSQLDHGMIPTQFMTLILDTKIKVKLMCKQPNQHLPICKIGSMTLILKLDLDMLKMYHHTKNEVSMSAHSKVTVQKVTHRQTYRHYRAITSRHLYAQYEHAKYHKFVSHH